MKLEKIITQANAAVRLEFLAMERSLRATGCKLPLLVLPYDEKKFDLPAGASWWEDETLFSWLASYQKHPGYRKYRCLLEANYQFVDTDVCFLKNPETVLLPYDGFITCCGHWHNPGHAVTAQSTQIMAEKSTVWQRRVFNAGQFAADRALYTPELLRKTAEDARYRDMTLYPPFHEQVGLNLLVYLAAPPFVNLTQPPLEVESSWAGDYPGAFEPYWKDEAKRPYLIHWAGGVAQKNPPINELFLSHLTSAERKEWKERQKRKKSKNRTPAKRLRGVLRRIRRAGRVLRDE